MSLNLRKVVSEYLKLNANKSFTAREIAEWIMANKRKECNEKIKNTKINSQEELISQIRAEIGARKEALAKDGILMTADRPRKYYYPLPKSSNELCKEKHKKITRTKNSSIRFWQSIAKQLV